ncbi:MAG: hypothetical protein JKY61_12790 [Planctomycetes bacterium]|nr:hypothetical protein [Planctomycetota bacterium]
MTDPVNPAMVLFDSAGDALQVFPFLHTQGFQNAKDECVGERSTKAEAPEALTTAAIVEEDPGAWDRATVKAEGDSFDCRVADFHHFTSRD